jgi:large subunit ribosomal protein L9
VVKVKDGYGRNFLIPRNMAVVATKGNLKSIGEITTQKRLRDNKRRREAEQLKISLEKISCTAEVQVGEEDRVFGSVTSHHIAGLLAAQGFVVDRRNILLDEPIKALGVYTVPIKIERNIVANMKVWVVKKD